MASVLAGSDVALRNVKKCDDILRRLEEVCGSKRREFLLRALRLLEPSIRRELQTSWARSGLHSKSGKLYEALVINSTIEFDGGGFVVKMPSGLDEHIYAQAGEKQYGGVFGTGRTTSKASTKFKQRLKGSSHGNLGGGVRVTQPVDPFSFHQDQAERIAEEFCRHFEEIASQGLI